MEIPDKRSVAVAAVTAIRYGDLDVLGSVLEGHPELAQAHIRDAKGGTRTLLPVAADWPRYLPNGPEVVCLRSSPPASPEPVFGLGGLGRRAGSHNAQPRYPQNFAARVGITPAYGHLSRWSDCLPEPNAAMRPRGCFRGTAAGGRPG
jgi:hypothetical protein